MKRRARLFDKKQTPGIDPLYLRDPHMFPNNKIKPGLPNSRNPRKHRKTGR